MPKDLTGTRAERLQARLALLGEEKALTRSSDEVGHNARRCPGCASTRTTASMPRTAPFR
jgi:predicted dithiol-disulfide oxidoreductase (DUF899 family)